MYKTLPLKISFLSCLLVFTLSILALPLSGQIYVDASVSPGGDGSTWATAYNDLQEALTAASSGDSIFVAEGTYFPTSTGDRTISFVIPNNVKLYGGFPTDGDDFDNRDWEMYKTILSGDIGAQNDDSDNSYHVVYTQNVSVATTVDGFTITGGNADGGSQYSDGGGWYNDGSGSGNLSNPSILNTVFVTNTAEDNGGGIYNYGENGESSPTLINCVFTSNTAEDSGGGIYNFGDEGESSPTLINCILFSNTAEFGSAIYNIGSDGGKSSPKLTNCVFAFNSADDIGTIYNDGDEGESLSKLINCIFYKNSVNNDGIVFYSYEASVSISHCLFDVDFFEINYTSDVSDDGGNLFEADPLFVDPQNGDFHLQPSSLAINRGDEMTGQGLFYSINGNAVDFALQPRFRNAIDMGVYEFNCNSYSFPDNIIYVDSAAVSGGNDGTSWSDAFTDLQSALGILNACPIDVNTVYVARGTYKPTSSMNRVASFFITDSVKIYGGFPTGGGSFAARNWEDNKTILSGDIGIQNDTTDNSYHVVYTKNAKDSTIVDGFVITGGNADGGSFHDNGGGWYNDGSESGNVSNPIILNSVFVDNSADEEGGGIYNNGRAGESSPVITNCKFLSNYADEWGGGIFNEGEDGESSPVIIQCDFTTNSAYEGGGIFNNGSDDGLSSPRLINCIFSYNSAYEGGGMYNNGSSNGASSPDLINCMFSFNHAEDRASAISNYGSSGESSPYITNSVFAFNFSEEDGTISSFGGGGESEPVLINCIFYENMVNDEGPVFHNSDASVSISHCLFDVDFFEVNYPSGVSDDGGNLFEADPLFVDPNNGDFHLQLPSPAINSGEPMTDENIFYSLNDNAVDLDLQPRFRNDIDMGVYEFICDSYSFTDDIIYVDSAAINGGNNGASWNDAFTDLQSALGMLRACPDAADKIYVAQGTYYPTSTGNRTVSFVLPDSVKMYGGFPAGGDDFENRDWGINKTILSGDIGVQNDRTDNSYHVVYTQNVSATTLVDGIVITGGNADGSFPYGRGGGWYNDGSGMGNTSNPRIQNCVFTSNGAKYGGGSILNFGDNGGESSPELINCIFTSNSTGGQGGAILNYGRFDGESSPKLVNCVFDSNSAGDGGAIFNDGLSGESSPELVNCEFMSNYAVDQGGAIYNNGSYKGLSSPRLVNCVFNSNSTRGQGGAILNYGGNNGGVSSPELVNCVFESNSADEGGAICNNGSYGGASSPKVINCAFDSNSADYGGAIYNDGKEGTSLSVLFNCVFKSNSADEGGAIYIYGGVGGVSSSILKNSIFYENTAQSGGPVFFNYEAFVSISHCLFDVDFSEVNYPSGVVSNDGGNLFEADPLFVDPNNGDFHLQLSSPAINSGDPSTSTLGFYQLNGMAVDLEFNPRIENTIDMGVFEFSCDDYSFTDDIIYVDSAAINGGNNGASWNDAFTDLQSALGMLRACPDAADKIYVAQGTYYPTSTGNRTVSFVIPNNVKLYGGFPTGGDDFDNRDWEMYKTILSGDIGTQNDDSDNSYHVVYTQNVSATTLVDGIVITGGNADGSFPYGRGGGWYNDGSGMGNTSNPRIQNCVFTSNGTKYGGGAILNFGDNGGESSPELINCVFTSNSTGGQGGAILNYGRFGGASSPELVNCVFDSNSAGDGGAIFNDGLSGESSPELVNCEFMSNYAVDQGGAIYNNGSNKGLSSPRLVNCVFNSNSTRGQGGAILNYGGNNGGESSPELVNCVFESNSADEGGAICNNGSYGGASSPKVINCVFDSNSADYGGAIYNDGKEGTSLSVLFNCVFKSNSADEGGAIYIYGGVGGVSSSILKNSIFYENTAQSGGPVFFNHDAFVSISHCLFDVDFSEVNYPGVSNAGGNLFEADPLFVDGPNGDFHLQLTSPAINSGDPSTIDTLFTVDGQEVDLDLSPRFSGIIDMGVYEFSCDDYSFTDDIIYVDLSATGGNNGTSWTDAYTDLQSALQLLKVCPNAADSIFVAEGTYYPVSPSDPGNVTTMEREISFVIPDSVRVYGGFPAGGDVFANRDWEVNETILSGDIGVQNDSTDNSYHVVYTQNVSAATLVDGFTITDGNADGSFPNFIGGGWYNDGSGSGNVSSPRIENCVFSSNSAGYAGAIANFGDNGGESSPELINCVFESNSAGIGGAILNSGREGVSSPMLVNCVFTSNTGSIGGAILNDGIEGVSTPKLVNCVFTSNTAGSDGGAIYNSGREGVSSPELVNCVFTSNTAGSDGGAIYNSGNEGVSSPELVNCVFTSNTAESDGGAINNDGEYGESSPELVNCVFESNSADEGGAIYSAGIGGKSSTKLKNSIFYENTAQSGGSVFYNFRGSVSISYSLFDESYNVVNHNSDVTDDGNNLFSTDPLFVDGPNGDFHLQLTSPAINSGDPSTIDTLFTVDGQEVDLDLSPRFSGIIDMGVYEFSCDDYSFTDDIIYVDLSATGGNNGTSWTDAYTDLQSALQLLKVCPNAADSIFVAEGTYYPVSPSDPGNVTTMEREISFVIPDSVRVYGGFPAGGDDIENRDWNSYETILSGDIGTQNDSTDNSYHVVYTQNVSAATTVDGFTITEGNADGGFNHDYGGGWYNDGSGIGNVSNPRIENCVFAFNYADFRGGAMYNDGRFEGNSSPDFIDCEFLFNSAEEAGAIFNDGKLQGQSSPNFIKCDFTSNSADKAGAIYNDGRIEGNSSPVFADNEFTNNYANVRGGAILNDTEDNGESSPELVNCLFISNAAELFGGAIYNRGYQSESSPELINCVFESNSAQYGGAICNNASIDGVSSPMMINCVFESNSAEDGGAIYNNGSSNGVSSPGVVNCVFTSNAAEIDGGAIYSFGIGGESSPILKNSIFYENTAQNEGPVFYTDNGSVSISYCLFDLAFFDVNNTFNVSDDGNNLFSTHPLFVDAANGDFHLQLISPAINRGDPSTSTMGFYQVNGMAVDLDLNPRIENTIDMGVFEINCGSHSFPDDIIYVDLTATSGGDNGTSWNDAFTDLQSALGILNACPDVADKIYVAQGTYQPTSTGDRSISFMIPDGVEVYGGFPNGGDDFENRDYVSYETILSGDVGNQNDNSDNSYHVVYTKNVSDATLVDGFTITQGNASEAFNNAIGGGWFNDGSELGNLSNPSIYNCKFSNNSAGNGGALYNDADNGGESSPELINCIFISNSASHSGGAIRNVGAEGKSSPVLIDCEFTSNFASLSGGAIYNSAVTQEGESSPVLENCVFTSNSADFVGGAIYNKGDEGGKSSPELKDCVFTSNSARDGGAIFNSGGEGGESSPLMTNCEFMANTVREDGGAIFNEGYDEGKSSPELINCIFESNTAEENGGAIYNYGEEGESSPLMTNCIFKSNSSDDGGAVYSFVEESGNSFPVIINGIFENNRALNGGAISSVEMDGEVRAEIVNCLFNGNVASNHGGSVSYSGASVQTINSHIVNSVFYENNPSTTIEIVYSDGDHVAIKNSIFYKNNNAPNTPPIHAENGGEIDISYSMFDGSDIGQTGVVMMLRANAPNNNFINTDPLFVDAANGDFHLQLTSPAINNGDPSTMANFYMVGGEQVDLDLNRRFSGVVDMGLYESPCDPSPQAMNCLSTIHPAIDGQGMMELYISEVAPGLSECANKLSVTVTNEWGGQVWRAENLTSQDLIMEGEDLCNYRGQTLTLQISNSISSCQTSLIIPQSPSIVLTSDFQSSKTASDYDVPTADLSRGKIVTYCGYIPDASLHPPLVTVSCNEGRGPGYYGLAVQPDWIMPINCTVNTDTAEVIFRTWEVFNKEGVMTTLTDTIVVMRLPALIPENFVGYKEDTTYCEIDAAEESGETVKRYAAWKQPMGLHDYELPTGKMGAVTYELPAAVLLTGYVNAEAQDLLDEYLACVILKKNDKAKTEYTIGDILSGFYTKDVLNDATSTQLTYGTLNIVARLADDWENHLIALASHQYFPYLYLEKGDRVLSADGYYEEVTDEWFWNGNGNSPYWFAAGWPSVYGSGDCIRYCDVVGEGLEDCVVNVLLPLLEDGVEGAVEICLNDISNAPHCGITVTVDASPWTGSCPQTKGQEVTVRQTCFQRYSNGEPKIGGYDWDGYADAIANDNHVVVNGDEYQSYIESDHFGDGKVSIQLSQWLTLQDTIGPVFDFCYPVDGGGIEGDCAIDNCEIGEWNHEGRWIGNLVNMDLKLNVRRYIPSGYVVLTDEEYQTLSDYEQSQFKPYPSEIEEAIRAGEQYSSAKDWEQCHPTVYTTESHDCATDIYVPSVTLKDNCSGLHSVKAMVNGRAVPLERLATTEEGYVTFAHTSNPIRIAFGGHGVQTEVRYEAADSCWNQSEWFKYIEIKDATPPTVVMDDEVLVSLTAKEAWVDAETFDEGSWDNCGIDLMLARRTDWWSDTACVDLCPTGETYTDWADLLEDLGFSDVDGALAGVYQCGEYDYDITALKKFLNSETVENHYYQKLVWLWEDSYECGEFVVHGWIYDMVKYILLNDNCSGPDADHGNRLKIEEFEGFLDAITGKPGYGKEVSYLGGGWSPAIPFKCEDACETPTVELLVMDYWCNWGKGWLDVEVEDKSQAKVHRALADVAISCESYNVNYKSIIEAAAAYGEGGSVNDSTGAFDALNAAFGYYEAAWVNSNGVITDAAGNEITIEDLRFSIENITCAETEEVTKVADTLHDGIIDWINVTERTTDLVAESIDHSLGLLSILCQSRIETQDVWVDLDDCGNGIITRRFDISGGCGPKAPSFTLEQNIYVNSACELGMSMFDTPADTYTQESPVCVTSLEAASTELAPSVTGKVELKADLVGALCNSIAIGVKEEYISEVQTTGTDGPQMYKLTRVWNIRDWCSTIERDYEQTIVFVVDANCAANNGDVSLTGQITDQDQEAIAEVEVKAVLNSGSPLTAETTGNGQYGFNLDWGSSVSIVPQKNTGHGQGITTQDVIAIQSHVMQESVLTSDYDKVAADVDGNGMINAFDILETRRMVLTPNRKLANNTSWRFFVSDGSMRESFESTSLRADQNIDFVGVKIGDVNRTENVGRSQRSGLTTLNLSVVDQGLISGELYRVDVTSENFDEITGMQYTLAYANNAVEVESIEGGALNFTEDNYVKYRPGFITASWSEGKAISVSENEVLFTLVVRAKADVSLRDVLSVSDRVIMAEAYTGSEELKNIQLQYNRRDAIFALYQNTPNPYAGQTAIGFTLPEASEATLTMYDVTGKVLKVVEGSYGKGYNKVWVNSEDFGMSGVLYYQLDTEKYTATKKMVVIK